VLLAQKKTVILSEDELPEDIFYLQDEIKPFSGTCYIYFSGTEILKEELNFKEGVLHGSRVSYFKNGQVKREGSYENGRYQGIWRGFNLSGNQLFEVEYKQDTLTGKFISWHATGVIKEKGLYKNNTRIGEWIRYDEAGMITRKELL
jgi:antitoxin component YwqK of YwqJK toxin-antitoxin module